MDFERQNKLPEGVGKRIIDALRTNIEEEPEDISGFELQNHNNYIENASYNHYDQNEYPSKKLKVDDCQHKEPEYKNYAYHNEEYINNNSLEYKEQKTCNKEKVNSSSIDTLIDLVTKLPPGVTKQTGAQIIRHTMEAMGIPMNKVLANAQMVQEELEQGVRNNINVIEEHRTKIKVLDQEIQQFRKKAQDLENIISLFILSENNK